MSNNAYSFKTNQAEKTMDMWVNGTFTEEDYHNFVRDYVKETSAINASEYVLNVDCRSMDLLDPEEVEKLKASFESYKKTGFKQVIFIITQAQVIIKMQLGRVARSAGLSNCEIVVD